MTFTAGGEKIDRLCILLLETPKGEGWLSIDVREAVTAHGWRF